MMLAFTLYKVLIAAFCVVAFVHLSGLLLLYKLKTTPRNQRILTMNLSIAEILFSLHLVCFYAVMLHPNNEYSSQILIVIYGLGTLLMVDIKLTMLYIIFDRFLEIYTNIKYPLYMTRKNLLIIMAIQWAISVICAITTVVLEFLEAFNTYLVFVSHAILALDIVILISAVTTYSYFYNTVKMIRRLEFNSSHQRNQKRKRLTEKFKIPCYIVLTYICFNLTNTIMLTTSRYVRNKTLSKILYDLSDIPLLIGFTSDVLIYVFGNRNAKMFLVTAVFGRNKQMSTRMTDLAIIQPSN